MSLWISIIITTIVGGLMFVLGIVLASSSNADLLEENEKLTERNNYLEQVIRSKNIKLNKKV